MKLVFLVGCPRSGTTWLQLLLSELPAVATVRETHLFSAYLGPWDVRWRFEMQREREGEVVVGLSRILSESDFLDLARGVANEVTSRILESKPGAVIVLEKTPNHIRNWEFIRTLFPECYFIHMVRDPRAVVRSLLAASATWASHWAPRRAGDAANRWLTDVSEGLRLTRVHDRAIEVRYEALLERGAEEIQRIMDFLGTPLSPADGEIALEKCSFDQLRAGRHDPEGKWVFDSEFFAKGTADSWKEDLSRRQLETLEFVAGDLMDQLGYCRSQPRRDRRPVRLWLGNGLRRSVNWLSARAHRVLDRL